MGEQRRGGIPNSINYVTLVMDRSRAALALLLWLFVAVRAGDGGEGAGDDDKQLSPLFFLTLEPGRPSARLVPN